MSDILLSAINISRILEHEIPITLVKNANVEIKRGEFVSIVGPSGSGKSSLLYLLGLLDKPTNGEIIIDGENTTNLDENSIASIRLKKLGFIFQSHFLLPEFSALENVMMPMRRLGLLNERAIQEKAIEILADLGLDIHAHKKPKQLSGGQNQRVAIARALANDPLIILADEPTGNLDSASSKAAQELLKDVAHKHNRAVIAVTHDMDFAKRTDRTIHIVDGMITVPESQ